VARTSPFNVNVTTVAPASLPTHCAPVVIAKLVHCMDAVKQRLFLNSFTVRTQCRLCVREKHRRGSRSGLPSKPATKPTFLRPDEPVEVNGNVLQSELNSAATAGPDHGLRQFRHAQRPVQRQPDISPTSFQDDMQSWPGRPTASATSWMTTRYAGDCTRCRSVAIA